MFFVAKICKRALRASIEGYLAVAASTPTYSSLVSVEIQNKSVESKKRVTRESAEVSRASKEVSRESVEIRRQSVEVGRSQ